MPRMSRMELNKEKFKMNLEKERKLLSWAQTNITIPLKCLSTIEESLPAVRHSFQAGYSSLSFCRWVTETVSPAPPWPVCAW